ncbi:MAG: NAD(P)-binding domain-containing protein [Bacteroidetes bacterium]|nr:NAD(P)-binding domain-containing protein [Bacteroidota bacterium]
MNKIGILGSGIVAKTLGKGFIKHGYDVMLGTRDISKLSDWVDEIGYKAKVGSFEEVAEFGETIVLAVSGKSATDVIEMAGPQNLTGKTVIDTTNPIAEAPPQDGVLKYFTTQDESLMEILQSRFPDAHFVKCFNSVGNAYMVNPNFPDGKPSMFICGNNDNAKKEVETILDKFGWETEDMGKATAARVIEQLCILWCLPGFLRNQWTHAFKLIKM